MKYPIVEIFSSIQGEGFHIGTPVTFVRFAGCNLRCPWCDTKYAYDVLPSTESLTIDEIIDRIHNCGNQHHVVLTGGEPTLYNLEPLIDQLHMDQHKYVSIETNGTRAIPRLMWRQSPDWVTCSPKPPDYQVLCNPDELKYVVDDQFTLDCVYRGPVPNKRIFLQVESARPESAIRAHRMAMTSGFRVGVQLHKILEVK